MTLTKHRASNLVTDSDVAFYGEHGWWISPCCLAPTMVDELAYGIARYYAGERDLTLPTDPGTDWSADTGSAVRQNDYVSLQITEVAEFVAHPLLPAMAARLSGSSEIRLFHDQLVYKPPMRPNVDTTVGWHTDRAYWSSCTSENMLTAWLPLEDLNEMMGPMEVIDGSHKWPNVEQMETFHEIDRETVLERFSAHHMRADPVTLNLRKGQVSFHHCRTIHGSGSNRSDHPRIGFTIHYQDESNRFRDESAPSARGFSHINDLLCRTTSDGLPDYSDPDICPVLWPRRNSRD